MKKVLLVMGGVAAAVGVIGAATARHLSKAAGESGTQKYPTWTWDEFVDSDVLGSTNSEPAEEPAYMDAPLVVKKAAPAKKATPVKKAAPTKKVAAKKAAPAKRVAAKKAAPAKRVAAKK